MFAIDCRVVAVRLQFLFAVIRLPAIPGVAWLGYGLTNIGR